MQHPSDTTTGNSGDPSDSTGSRSIVRASANKRLKGLRAALIAGGLGTVCQLAAVETVADVVLEGTVRIHPNKILGQLKTKRGTTLEQAVLNEDVVRLQKMGFFLKPRMDIQRIAPGKVKVIFTVEELPYVGEVRIEGVSVITRSSMLKKIETKRGVYINPLQIEVDANTLLEHLRNSNYLHARVEHFIEMDEASQIGTVVFKIHTSYQVQVGKVYFEGLPEGVHRFFLLQPLTNQMGRTYDKDRLEWDHQQVLKHVRARGYMDAQVSKPEVLFLDQVKAFEDRGRTGPMFVPDGHYNDRVAIRYRVTAGPRYRLGKVRFIGQSVVSEEKLREEFGMAEGELFIHKDVSEAMERSLALLRDNGYARATFIEDPIAKPDTHVVDLTLQLIEGDLYSVGRIDIFGNTITKDAVLRRALKLEPGVRWSDDKRDRSERDIMRSGVFKPSPFRRSFIRPDFNRTRPSEIDPDTTEVDVTVDVDEDKTGRFSFNIGFSSEQGIIGRIEFSERNFDLWGLVRGQGWRGAAHKLNASAAWSDKRTSLSVSWRNPSLMDSRYSLGVALARTDSSVLDWDEVKYSSRLSFGRRFLDNDLLLSAAWGIYHLEVEDVDFDASNEALDGVGKYLNNSVSLSQEYDRLDNRRLPTEGWIIKSAQRLTGVVLPADDEFYALELEGMVYVPLARSDLGGTTYLSLRQSFTHMGATGDSDNVPFYDRLFGGGPAPRHRGFDNFDLGPFEINRNDVEARVGGTDEWLTTLELVYPLQGRNELLRLVGFADIGNVWAEDEDVELEDLRTAVGAGIRFPANFPISLDFAWLLDPKPGEASNQFHFSLSGFTF